ncbi:hypothetical protein B0H17DRAFT_1133290 [Mycena rosella]|uniref:Uncharacterized protein n=1 Tax=Mycena rosella TaxID=1033263 RepID=A0AAD7DI58_MYCRO|nr:hypothetical protein B0H17DRAFT_1133290 [Mycena rosella]
MESARLWKGHLLAPAHLKSLQTCADWDRRASERHQQYANLYISHPVNLRDPPAAPVPALPQFPAVFSGEDSKGISLEDFGDWMMADNRSDTERIANREFLRREIELLHRTDLEEEFEGADDETVPRFLDGLDGIVYPNISYHSANHSAI